MASKPSVTIPDGPAPTDLLIEDLEVGTGDEAVDGKTCTMQYVGHSWSTGKQFDASWDRGQPFSFQLGAGMVIQGWDLGVKGMRVGGRRRLTIPAGPGLRPARRRVGHQAGRDARVRRRPRGRPLAAPPTAPSRSGTGLSAVHSLRGASAGAVHTLPHTACTGARRAAHPGRAPPSPAPLDGRTGRAYRRAVTAAEQTLVDAVERVRELSLRLWAVRAAHPCVRGLLGRLRCGTCGGPHPCRTLLAAGATTGTAPGRPRPDVASATRV